MNENQNQPSARKFWSWFNPAGRKITGWGFSLNRITALGLTLYLYLHLIILSSLASGPDAYESFLKLIHSPIYIFGEFLVVAAGIIHGFNGIRIALTSFGIAVPQQKPLFVALMILAGITCLFFAIRMFTA
jgi:succinate dehydrogenase / fumarate reductase cytochrome b subunit